MSLQDYLPRNMSRFMIASAFLITLSVGCGTSNGVSYRMAGYVDPDFVGRKYDTISVHMITEALYQRRGIETRIVNELKGIQVVAYESGTLLPPTRSWDSLGVERELEKVGVSGAIRVREADRWVDSYWVPKKESTTVTTREKPKKKKENNRGDVDMEVVTEVETKTEIETRTTGGYTKEEEKTRFDVDLVDLASGRIAWTGSLVVKGNDYRDLARRIVGQLGRDSMVARK